VGGCLLLLGSVAILAGMRVGSREDAGAEACCVRDPARLLWSEPDSRGWLGGLIYPMGGTIDGVRGDHVLLAPPFIVSAGDVDAIVERLEDAVDAVV
jgi:hypothetical protein